MDKQIHIVFPKEYMDTIVQVLENGGYKVTSKDHVLETFYHWATGEEQKDYTSTALIIDALDEEIPVEAKAEEYVRYLTEIRIHRPNMRLVINLPSQFRHMKQMQRNFVSLSIYDFYFEDNFSTQSIFDWLENPKTLADVKDFIVHEQSYPENKVVTKTGPYQKEVNSDKDNNDNNNKNHEIKNNHNNIAAKLPENDRKKAKQRRFSINVSLPRKPMVVEKYVTMYQQNIAFISLSRGAGSTFHSLNLASYLRDRGLTVGVYEQPIHYDGRSYLADVLDLFGNEPTTKELTQKISVPHLILERKPIFLEQVPKYNNIEVFATDYDRCIRGFNNEQFARYINTGRYAFKIVDLGYVPSDWLNKVSFIDLLNTFQHIVIVIDLIPTAFNSNSDRLTFFYDFRNSLYQNSNLQFLINRYNSYIPKKELRQIRLEEAHQCPMFPYDQIFKAIYDKKTPYDMSEDIENELSVIYKGLLDEIRIEESRQNKKRKGIRGILEKVRL